MSKVGWSEVLFTSTVDGPTLTAAAEALMVSDVTIPGGYWEPGRIMEATMFGKASNAVTTPGTLTLKSRWGGLAGTILATSAALTQNVAAQTDKTFWMKWILKCLTVGTTGTLIVWATAHRGNCANAVVGDITPDMIPASAPAAVTVDTSVDKLLTFTATPSLTTASFTVQHYQLVSLN